jgi:hypothetical protein
MAVGASTEHAMAIAQAAIPEDFDMIVSSALG